MFDEGWVELARLAGTRASDRRPQRSACRRGLIALAPALLPQRWFAWLCTALVFASVAPASARERAPAASARSQPKVVVIRGFPAVERAIAQALAPWKMRVELVSARQPGATMPVSADRAQVLAEQLKADALVWISTSPEGPALWVHDARTNNVTSRATPRPPFDPPTAAALALSVKTFLRASGLTPEEAPGAPDSAASPAPRLSEQPSRAPAQPEPRPAPAPATLSVMPEPERASLQVLVHAAARLGAFQPPEGGARYGLQLRWSPWAHRASAWNVFWLGLDLETATPWLFSRAEFDGQLWEAAPGLCAGVLGHIGEVFRAGVQVRSALHVLSLSGTFFGDPRLVQATSVSPSLLIRPELGLTISNVTLLLQPGAGAFLQRHEYEDLQSSLDVLQSRRIWWMLGGAISLRAD